MLHLAGLATLFLHNLLNFFFFLNSTSCLFGFSLSIPWESKLDEGRALMLSTQSRGSKYKCQMNEQTEFQYLSGPTASLSLCTTCKVLGVHQHVAWERQNTHRPRARCFCFCFFPLWFLTSSFHRCKILISESFFLVFPLPSSSCQVFEIEEGPRLLLWAPINHCWSRCTLDCLCVCVY